MKKEDLKNITEKLFDYFEKNIEFSGEYLSRTTNAVLAFDNWASEIDYSDIKDIVPELDEDSFDELVQYISDQVELYLLRNAPRW